jgi:glycosyltransferase involved in cell wall biosynthesis
MAESRPSSRCSPTEPGPVRPGQEEYFAREIELRIDGEQVVFLQEVGGARRKELFARAKALLMPISWAEPFGLVMVEALVCGTPVFALPEGAVSEIVIDGENGFQVADEQQISARRPQRARAPGASPRGPPPPRATIA